MATGTDDTATHDDDRRPSHDRPAGAHERTRESGREVLAGFAGLDDAGREALREVLDGRWKGVRDAARARMAEEATPPVTDLPTDEHRRLTLERLRALADGGPFAAGFPVEVGGDGDIGGSVTAIQVLGHADLSVMVKAGVQWGLFGGAITALGTAEHHRRYLPGAMDLSLLGCFAMTESGHGSDVESLGTTATYDPVTDELVVHTPTPRDRKDYIGNTAEHGRLAVVFAQLVVGGEGRGVHAVVVPIRNKDGSPATGVTIGDDGRKGGLNGVDNGRLSFDHVRVPRADPARPVRRDRRRRHVLEPDREPEAPVLHDARHAGARTHLRRRRGRRRHQSALTIAIRYALRRRQFERTEDGEEVLLLDYQAHQRRLLPALATTYALHLAQSQLTEELHDVQTAGALGGDGGDEDAQRALETQAAGIKAVGRRTPTPRCRRAGGLRRRRLPRREPPGAAARRRRRVRHLRGRQHGAAPARRQGAAHRLHPPRRRAGPSASPGSWPSSWSPR